MSLDAPVPDYAAGSLADVLPAVLAAMGVPGLDGGPVSLPAADRACVLLVDGLGARLLADHAAQAPFLSSLQDKGSTLTAGFPSTTATSLTSFGTGLAPGRHGIVGYTFALPGEERLLNALRWDTAADPHDVQPAPTVLELAAADGVAVTHLGPRAFAGSGMTRAALRGAEYPGAETVGELVGGVQRALRQGDRAFAYAYFGDLDNVGHLRGCESPDWLAQLRQADLLAEQIAEGLPQGAALHVVADHGMVDVPEDRRIDVETESPLVDGVRLVGGEPRARHVYTTPGAAEAVLAAWREVLADRAWVVAREQALEAGWFGPEVTAATRERVGDVVAAARDRWAMAAGKTQPLESLLVGYHGSLTPDELEIPLLSYSG